MRALHVTEFGPVSTLRLIELPDPTADSATAIVKVAAGAVSPRDVKNVEGQREHTTLPRVPGARRCRHGHPRPGRMAWRGGLGNRGRARLFGRWPPRGTDGRPSREPSAQAQGAVLRAGGGERGDLPRRLARRG